jgi:hypothetical protein
MSRKTELKFSLDTSNQNIWMRIIWMKYWNDNCQIIEAIERPLEDGVNDNLTFCN